MEYFLELYLSENFLFLSFLLLFGVISVFLYIIIRMRIKRKLTLIKIDMSFYRYSAETKSDTALLSSIISIFSSLVVVMTIGFVCQSMISQRKTVISSHTYEQGKEYAFYCDDDLIWNELNADIRKIVDRDKFENAIANNDNKLLIEEKVIDNYSENGLSSTNEYPKQSEIDDKYDEVLLNVEDSRESDNDPVNYHALVVNEVEIEYLYKGEELNTKKLVLEVTREVR